MSGAMRLPILLAAVQLTLALCGRADDFCAVTLSVRLSDGQPVPSASARLIDPSGETVQRKRVINGRAEFCDFGFGPHSILVRAGSDCGSVLLRGVRLAYGFAQTFGVILNTCGYEGNASGNACFTYLRVASPDGKPLAGVEIKETGVTSPIVATDRYGRASVSVHAGAQAEFTLLKPGYKTDVLHLGCPTSGRGRPLRLWDEMRFYLVPTSDKGGPTSR